MTPFRSPDYAGGGLLNLVADVERRLTGEALHPGLTAELAGRVPDADSYLLVLFDGLGDHQLDHPAAASLRAARAGVLDSCFPSTTTVNLATIATGRTPAEHGLLGYQAWFPDVGEVVNTIQWTTPKGKPVEYDVDGLLPSPSLAERLAASGIEAIALQPGGFDNSPMTRMLYGGARFEAWYDEDQAVDIARGLATVPRRLVFLYLPHVDFAAHVAGQASDVYAMAMTIVDRLWARLQALLPDTVSMVGTADHGHVDVALDRQIRLSDEDHEGRIIYGDARAMFIRGEGASLAERYPATWVPRADMEHWWGPGTRHPAFADRAPDGVLVAHDGHALLHRYADDRLIGQHGAVTEQELRVPLLVAG